MPTVALGGLNGVGVTLVVLGRLGDIGVTSKHGVNLKVGVTPRYRGTLLALG